VCDQETSKTRRLKPATGLWRIQPQWVVTPGKQTNYKELDVINEMQGVNNFKIILLMLFTSSLVKKQPACRQACSGTFPNKRTTYLPTSTLHNKEEEILSL
jgi:hypothetical protein